MFPLFQGFFKRSIPKADKYKCFFGGQCDITPKNRNRCKACRFKLCLQFGMSVDGKFCYRNRCKACRFKLCLQFGMSVDGKFCYINRCKACRFKLCLQFGMLVDSKFCCNFVGIIVSIHPSDWWIIEQYQSSDLNSFVSMSQYDLIITISILYFVIIMFIYRNRFYFILHSTSISVDQTYIVMWLQFLNNCRKNRKFRSCNKHTD